MLMRSAFSETKLQKLSQDSKQVIKIIQRDRLPSFPTASATRDETAANSE